jgi:hypothetical protein
MISLQISMIFSNVLYLVARKLILRSSQTGPWFTTMPLRIYTRALRQWGGSPVAMYGHGRWTSDIGLRLDSPRTDWRWWLGRRWLRWASATRLWRRVRLDTDFGEGSGGAWQLTVRGVKGDPRVKLGGVGRRQELVEARAHDGDGHGGRADECAHTGGRGATFIDGRARQSALALALKARVREKDTRGRRSRAGCRPADRGVVGLEGGASVASTCREPSPTSDTVVAGRVMMLSLSLLDCGSGAPAVMARQRRAQRESAAQSPGCWFKFEVPHFDEPKLQIF